MTNMDQAEIERLAGSVLAVLGIDTDDWYGRWDKKRNKYIKRSWQNSPKIKKLMFDAWSDQQHALHRVEENKYFWPSRLRDREAQEKAMQDPQMRKMAHLIRSRDYALDRGEPWIPNDWEK